MLAPCLHGAGLKPQHAPLQRQQTSLLRLCRPSLVHRPAASTLIVRAEGSGLGGFFGKGGAKEDAAKKALQDALKGKKDPFAAAEKKAKERAGRGGGGGGGRGGGGGGGGGGFNFNEWGDKFRKGLGSMAKTIAAVLLFLFVLFGASLFRPTLALLSRLVRIVLRLDSNPRMVAAQKAAPQLDLSKKEGLGNVEESIIGKYGAEAAGDEGGESEEEGSEEEE